MQPLYQQSGANIAFWILFGVFVLGEYAMRIRVASTAVGVGAER
jgi:hypothetical protein